MRLIPRAAWPELLADPALRLELDRRWLGYQVRRVAWRARHYLGVHHRLWLVEEGLVQVEVQGRRWQLGPGSLLWLPPGLVFACAWPPLLRFHELLFRLYRGRDELGVAEGVQTTEGAWELVPLWDRVADLAGKDQVRHATGLRHLLAALVAEASALVEAPPAARGLDASQRSRLERAVRERITERLVPADLARLLDLSPDYCARLFRASFGCSPRAWLADERIRAAARLIHEGGQAPAAAAAALGFGDLAQFSRRFRAVMGQAPRRWKRGLGSASGRDD